MALGAMGPHPACAACTDRGPSGGCRLRGDPGSLPSLSDVGRLTLPCVAHKHSARDDHRDYASVKHKRQGSQATAEARRAGPGSCALLNSDPAEIVGDKVGSPIRGIPRAWYDRAGWRRIYSTRQSRLTPRREPCHGLAETPAHADARSQLLVQDQSLTSDRMLAV
jgi:hypothetical protein